MATVLAPPAGAAAGTAAGARAGMPTGPASAASRARSTSWRTTTSSGIRRSAMGQHPVRGGVVTGEHVERAGPDRGEGDRPAPRARGDPHAQRLAREVLQWEAD